MTNIRPFRGIRPANDLAASIAALPYDVYNRTEAKEVVHKNPLSFLKIDRAETQFPDEVNMYSDEVYDRARDTFLEMLENGSFVRDTSDCFYLYALTMNGHTQTGIVGCASIDDYLNNVIRKHENTLEAKEQDRIRHIDALSAQTGPIFLAYRQNQELHKITEQVKSCPPVSDFVSEDGVRHQVWQIANSEMCGEIVQIFEGIDHVYIADGHHRAASAVKVGLMRRKAYSNCSAAISDGRNTETDSHNTETNSRNTETDSGDTETDNCNMSLTCNETLPSDRTKEFNYFLSVLFPAEELTIYDYNRVVEDMNGYTVSELLTELQKDFEVEMLPSHSPAAHTAFDSSNCSTATPFDNKCTVGNIESTCCHPANKGEFSMYCDGIWYRLTAKPHLYKEDPVDSLDVSILQDVVLGPLLGITDPKTDSRIRFVGGIRGLQELARLVDAKPGRIAFALYPTSMEELLDVADAGRLMPPKSTWFEPKLRSGLFIHEIER